MSVGYSLDQQPGGSAEQHPERPSKDSDQNAGGTILLWRPPPARHFTYRRRVNVSDEPKATGLKLTLMSSTNEPTPSPTGTGARLGRVVHWFAPHPLPPPVNPALLKHAEERAKNAQNRAADRITAFSGSMLFVYIHILWFGLWIGLGVEKYPFGLLTMIVSLEAIFLSTFVMISQNRADARRQVLSDQQYQMIQEEKQQNEELLKLSKQILELTKEVGSYTGTIQREDDQNQELLDLSRQTLALTKEVSARFSAGDGAGSLASDPANGKAERP